MKAKQITTHACYYIHTEFRCVSMGCSVLLVSLSLQNEKPPVQKYTFKFFHSIVSIHLHSTSSSGKPKASFRCGVCSYETSVARNLRIHWTSEKHTHNMVSTRMLSIHSTVVCCTVFNNLLSNETYVSQPAEYN